MKPPRILLLACFILVSSCAGCTAAHPIHRHGTHTHIYHPAKTFHNLIGSHSGNNVTGIKDVKSYLQRFGYLNNHKDSNYQLDDSFDSSLELAVLTYQSFFKLNKTGVLDNDTISMMSKPRCGNPDIVNNKNNINFPLSSSVRSRMLYNFAPGKPKRTKDELYVVIQNNVPSELVDAIRHAFADWEPYIPLQFLPTNEPGGVVPDIRVGFYKGDHGDGQAFDGPRGILAHSSFSLGALHFNAEQYWTIGSNPFSYDVATVARHEIGHLLGLDHTDVHDALMYPWIDRGVVKGIGIDDEAGIRALYGT